MKYTLKIRLEHDGHFCMGPGVLSLMEEIDKCKSVSSAAQAMDMSYSKAWKIIHEAEAGFGEELVVRSAGGAAGGTAQITEKCRAYLESYRNVQNEVKDALEKSLEKNFGEKK